MRRKLPPLNALVAFDAAARHGNFTRAGKELNVAQPAITRHIANLENWIGVPLFHRGSNAVALTAAGEQLAELATSALDRLELGLQHLSAPTQDEVVLGASFGIMHLYVMPRITALRRASRATLNFMTSDDYRAFDHPSVDLSIRFGNGNFGAMDAHLLFGEICHVLASPEFIAAHPELERADMARHLKPEWLLDHGDPQKIGWMTWPLWFRSMGVEGEMVRGRREVRNYPAMLDMVSAGEGIAIGSVGLEDDLVEGGRIQRLGPPVARPGYGYYLVSRRETLGKPALRDLRAYLLGGGT
ncbi:MAG: LysR family transcriptional regulator [Arenibacterium sp.]